MGRQTVTEEWRPVADFEGLYSVSNLGRVRRDSARSGTQSGFILTPSVGKFGYHRVHLRDGKRNAYRTVHRLVLFAFDHSKKVGEQANHLDGNKANNRIENLAWVTAAENAQHAWRTGLSHRDHRPKPYIRGELNKQAKLTENDVREIRSSALTHAALGRRFGVDEVTIGQVRMRRSWKHVM